MARVDSRGNNTPTRLHTLRFDARTPPPSGTDLLLDGKVVGTVTSAVALPGDADNSIGLGYVRRAVEAPATLAAVHGDRELMVQVAALPA